jgi:hypothetical protein
MECLSYRHGVGQYDLLIYSPSTPECPSSSLTFDSLVAYLVSSPMTPSVDKALQQLFRVRNLTTGDMRLFVHDTRPGVQLPHTVEQIEPMLSSDICSCPATSCPTS